MTIRFGLNQFRYRSCGAVDSFTRDYDHVDIRWFRDAKHGQPGHCVQNTYPPFSLRGLTVEVGFVHWVAGPRYFLTDLQNSLATSHATESWDGSQELYRWRSRTHISSEKAITCYHLYFPAISHERSQVSWRKDVLDYCFVSLLLVKIMDFLCGVLIAWVLALWSLYVRWVVLWLFIPVSHCVPLNSMTCHMTGLCFGTFLFHTLGMIIPTDFHIFQRGGSTTNQIFHRNITLTSAIRLPFDLKTWSEKFMGHPRWFTVTLWLENPHHLVRWFSQAQTPPLSVGKFPAWFERANPLIFYDYPDIVSKPYNPLWNHGCSHVKTIEIECVYPVI